MEPSIKDQLDEQGRKIDAIFESVEKTRKYFQMVMWLTVAFFVLPLIGLLMVIPTIMEVYTSSIDILNY